MREEEWIFFILIFCKTFSIFSHYILTEIWMNYGLHKRSVQWAENWLNCCSENVMSSTKSIWRPVTSGISLGVNTDAFWPVFSCGFHLFLADLNPQRGSHRYKPPKLAIEISCTSNCGPVVTLLLKSLFVPLQLRQKSTRHTLLLIIILRAAQWHLVCSSSHWSSCRRAAGSKSWSKGWTNISSLSTMSQIQIPWQKVLSADGGLCTLQVRAFGCCHLSLAPSASAWLRASWFWRFVGQVFLPLSCNEDTDPDL